MTAKTLNETKSRAARPESEKKVSRGPAHRGGFRGVSPAEFLESFARQMNAKAAGENPDEAAVLTAAEPPTSLTGLLELYRLISKSEGKSKNTTAIAVTAVNDLNRYLVLNGRSTEVLSIDAMVLREYIVNLQERPRFEHHRFTPPQEGKLSPSTINCYPRAQRAFFNCLQQQGIIEENPFDRLVIPPVPTKVIPTFSDEQLYALFKAIDPQSEVAARDRAILLLLLDTGIRLGELIGLSLEAVDLEQRLIRVKGKGNKERQVPLGTRLQSALWQYINLHRPQPAMPRFNQVFLTVAGRPLKKDRLETIVRRFGQRAGITGVRVSPHTFRHTFAISYLRNGGDVFSLQAILGHAQLDTVKIYLQLAQTDLSQAHLTSSPADNIELPLGSLRKPKNRR